MHHFEPRCDYVIPQNEMIKSTQIQNMINQPYSSLLCSGEQHKYFHDSIWIQEKESIIFRILEWSFMRKCTSSTYQTCWICVWGYPTKSLEALLSLSDSAVCDSPKHIGNVQPHVSVRCFCRHSKYQQILHQPEVGILCCSALDCPLSQ